MIWYDWRRCPSPMMTPDAVADYGPFSADIGTRQFPRVNGQPYAPARDVFGDEAPSSYLDRVGSDLPFCWIIAGVLAWTAFGKKGRRR